MKTLKLMFLGTCLLGEATSEAAPNLGFTQSLSRTQVTISASGRAVRIFEEKNTVTTLKGATDLSNYTVEVQDESVKFQLVRAQVKTDGKSYVVSSDKVRKGVTQNASADGGLRKSVQYIIPFEQVKVGSEISITYRLTSEPVIKGVYFDAAGISNDMLADSETTTYISDLPLKVVTQNFDNFYQLSESKVGRRYKIEIAPTQMARQMVGKVQKVGIFFVSTSQSWRQINDLVSSRYEQAIVEPLPKAFAEIVKEAKSQTDSKKKIEFVADRLKKIITYAGDWTTVRGQMFPSGHEAVTKSGRGDCKDYSTSMTAILRQLGFHSNVALSFRSAIGSDLSRSTIGKMSSVPSLAYFNHAIVWAKDSSGQEFWLDPTNPIVIANVLSSDLLGNFALILDGKSDATKNLPENNFEPTRMIVSQTVTIRPDETAIVAAVIDLNAPAYNDIANIERQVGPEGMKVVLSFLLNPRSKMQTDFERIVEGGKQQYRVKASGDNWLYHEKKDSYVLVNHPASLFFLRMSTENEFAIGAHSETVYTTTLKNQQVVDPIDDHCIARSQWMDIDREVHVIGEDTIVKDRVVTKATHATVEQLRSEEFKIFAGDVRQCIQGTLLTKRDPQSRTIEELNLEEQKGPDVSKLTEADVKKILDSNELRLNHYHYMKLRVYYINQFTKDPTNLEAWAGAADMTWKLGYIRGDEYKKGFVQDAMSFVERGMATSSGKFNAYLFRMKIRLNLQLDNLSAATADFKTLVEKDPKFHKTADVGYFISKRNKNLDHSEKWLKHGIALATAASDKDYYRGRLATVYELQNRPEEAAKIREELLQGPGATAWDWHNAAVMYLEQRNLDKAIEYERKALSMMDFGVARQTLSDLLVYKSFSMGPPSSFVKDGKLESSPSEPLLLEALKYNGENVQALIALSSLNIEYGRLTQDKAYFEKAHDFAARALRAEPKDAQALRMMAVASESVKFAPASKAISRRPAGAKVTVQEEAK